MAEHWGGHDALFANASPPAKNSQKRTTEKREREDIYTEATKRYSEAELSPGRGFGRWSGAGRLWQTPHIQLPCYEPGCDGRQ